MKGTSEASRGRWHAELGTSTAGEVGEKYCTGNVGRLQSRRQVRAAGLEVAHNKLTSERPRRVVTESRGRWRTLEAVGPKVGTSKRGQAGEGAIRIVGMVPRR